MCLDNNFELSLANLHLNAPVREPIIFDDGDPFEGLSSTPLPTVVTFMNLSLRVWNITYRQCWENRKISGNLKKIQNKYIFFSFF
jgi:hypothetical protein